MPRLAVFEKWIEQLSSNKTGIHKGDVVENVVTYTFNQLLQELTLTIFMSWYSVQNVEIVERTFFFRVWKYQLRVSMCIINKMCNRKEIIVKF